MAYEYCQEIPNHFPFVGLDEFIIMPNHVHGIIIIDKSNNKIVETQDFASLHQQNIASQHISSQPKEKLGPQSKNIASIICGF